MKKLLLLFALVPSLVQAQLQEVNSEIDFQPQSATFQDVTSGSKSTSCGPDTVLYTLQKATGLTTLDINNMTSAQSIGQYFNCPQPITLSGVEFFAYKLDATGGVSTNVTVAVYTAGPDSMPTTAPPIVTATVPVDTNFGGGALNVLSKIANFPAVTVTAPYVVVVENVSPNGVGLVCTDYAAVPADGGMEWLSSANLFGAWTRSYDLNVGGVPFDSDGLFYPFVSYTLDAGFTQSADCFSGGPTINFTNTSSPILGDRMYSLAAYFNLESIQYTWNFGDGSPEVNAIDTFNVYANTSQSYTVMLTDTLLGWTTNCVDSDSSFLGDDLDVVWSSTPTGNGSVDFTDNSTSTSAVINWLWDFGDGNTSTQQNPTHTYAASGNYLVCLTAVTLCGVDSTCGFVDVVICNNPTAAFSETNNDPAFDFTDGSTTTGNVTYSWDFGDGNTSTQQNPSHTYIDNGTYTVTLTITDDCGTDVVTTTVTVTNGCDDPVASFTQSGTEPTFTFTNASTTGANTTYSWDMGDGTMYTTMDVNHTYSANNTYTVTLIVTDDCGADTTTQTVTVATIGLLDLDQNEFIAYPNPANEVLNIQSDFVINAIELMDMTGRIVISNNYNAEQVDVNTAHLAEGHYTLRAVHSDGSVIVQPIEVIH